MKNTETTQRGQGLPAEHGSAVTIPAEEYQSLLRDKARLDYLENAHIALNARYKTDYGWKLIINHNVVRFMAGHCYPRDDGYPGIDLHDSHGSKHRRTTCRDALDESIFEAGGGCYPCGTPRGDKCWGACLPVGAHIQDPEPNTEGQASPADHA